MWQNIRVKTIQGFMSMFIMEKNQICMYTFMYVCICICCIYTVGQNRSQKYKNSFIGMMLYK